MILPDSELLLLAQNQKAKRELGQNFLVSSHWLNSIASSLSAETKLVVEIGPGLGFLTACLLGNELEVMAVDLDERLLAKLPRHPKLSTMYADACQLSFEEMREPFSLIGNLPFNAGTKILLNIIGDYASDFWNAREAREVVFMFQLEVAERMVAQPRSKAFGPLSMLVQAKAEVELLFEVKRKFFHPEPRVDTGVVRFRPRVHAGLAGLSKDKRDTLQKVLRQAFIHRRKKIKNNLLGVLTLEDFTSLQISPDSRAEDLSFDDYLTIAKYLP